MTSKTKRILDHLLTHGPAASVDIARELGMGSASNVTALLKNHTKRGQVIRVDGCLMINPDWDASIAGAIQILERAGYTVMPPSPRGETEDAQERERAAIAERKRLMRERMARV